MVPPSPPRAAAQLPPSLAARYRVLRVLGEGSFGVVFLAQDRHLDREVALKVLRPRRLDGGRARARLRREAELLMALAHPAIVPLLDADLEADPAFLASVYYPGGDLGERLRQAPQGPIETAALGATLAEALAQVHEAGLLHRDIKPANVLLDEAGRPALGDFGLGLAREGTERLTTTGMVVGSPRYMAPEILETGRYSPASDVYALGVTLLEVCEGRAVSGPPGAPAALALELPASPLRALLLRCLRSSPAGRPTAQELAQLLGAAAHPAEPAPEPEPEPEGGRETLELPASSASSRTTSGRRSPLGPLLAVLAFGGLAGLLVGPPASPALPPGSPPVPTSGDVSPEEQLATQVLAQLSALGGVRVDEYGRPAPEDATGPTYAILDGDPLAWQETLARLPALAPLGTRHRRGPSEASFRALDRVRTAFEAQDLPDPTRHLRPGPLLPAPPPAQDPADLHPDLSLPRPLPPALERALARFAPLRVTYEARDQALRRRQLPPPGVLPSRVRLHPSTPSLPDLIELVAIHRSERIALWRSLRELEGEARGVLEAFAEALVEPRGAPGSAAALAAGLLSGIRPLFWGRLLRVPAADLVPGDRATWWVRSLRQVVRRGQLGGYQSLRRHFPAELGALLDAAAEDFFPAPEAEAARTHWTSQAARWLAAFQDHQRWRVLGELVAEFLEPLGAGQRELRWDALFRGACALEVGGDALGLTRSERRRLRAALASQPAWLAARLDAPRQGEPGEPRASTPQSFLEGIAPSP